MNFHSQRSPNVIIFTKVQELLRKIASGSIEPAEVLERYTVAEIQRAREICFEDGYMPALIALKAILKLVENGERTWIYPPSRPAHLVDVEVSYLYEGEPTTDYAFLGRANGDGEEIWRLTGRDDIVVKPYAWRPIAAPAPVRS